MNMASFPPEWRPLIDALDRIADYGGLARFWLRDDDAVEPTAQLARLLGQLQAGRTPATLAVIPEHSGDALAGALAEHADISVSVHGWSHRNYACPGEKKQELGVHRPQDVTLGELKAGLSKLQALHGKKFAPLLTPPWNRIDRSLLPQLEALGFRAISVFNDEKPGPIREINTHVDIMDWHGNRGGRETAPLVSEIIARLERVEDSGGLIGVLSHHIVHDERAERFISELLEITCSHPAARWVDIRTELV